MLKKKINKLPSFDQFYPFEKLKIFNTAKIIEIPKNFEKSKILRHFQKLRKN